MGLNLYAQSTPNRKQLWKAYNNYVANVIGNEEYQSYWHYRSVVWLCTRCWCNYHRSSINQSLHSTHKINPISHIYGRALGRMLWGFVKNANICRGTRCIWLQWFAQSNNKGGLGVDLQKPLYRPITLSISECRAPDIAGWVVIIHGKRWLSTAYHHCMWKDENHDMRNACLMS